MANGNVLGRYEFQFDFNTKDAKKQILAISNDFKSQLQEMDTASSKMSVLSNIVGYLEKLDKALDQFKAEHKDDFKDMFAGLDDQLTGSLKSMLGMSTQDWDKLTGIKGRITSAKENKAGVSELRAIAKDINYLLTSIGDRELINIDELFKGKGVKFQDRIQILENTLDEFYMSYQFVTNSIKDGFGTGGMAGINSMSKEAQKEAQGLRDVARELNEVRQQMQIAQSNIQQADKGNKDVQEKYKVDLTADAVRGLIDTYETLDGKLHDSNLSAKEYCDTLLQMAEVIIKLKNAQKAAETNEDFKSILQNESGYTGNNLKRRQDSYLNGSLSLYSKALSKDVMDRRMGDQFAVYIQDMIKQNMQRFVELVPNIIGNGLSGTHGVGTGKGDGRGSGSGKSGQSYNELKTKIEEFISAHLERIDLDPKSDRAKQLEVQLEEIQEELTNVHKLSAIASDSLNQIFESYQNAEIDENELIVAVSKFLGFSEQAEEQLSNGVFAGVGQHAVAATEYIHAMTNAIREMFDVLSKASDIEYKALIGGTDIAIRAGQESEISAKTTAEAFLANLMQDTDVEAHSHMGRSASINAPDFLQAKRHQYGGLSKISAVIGGKDIVTLDLSKVKKEDADLAYKKLQEATKGNRTEVSVEEFNKILTDINPEYTDVAKKWDPSNFRELATYIYNVKQSAEQTIGPLEKLKQLLNVMAPSKVIDYSKYASQLDTLSKDNVGDVFNYIARAEGITEDNKTLQVDAEDISTMSVDALIADIQQKKDALAEARKALKISYQEIEQLVDQYSKSISKKDSKERDFLKQYFHESELQEIDQLFRDKAYGNIKTSDLVNNIASRFGVEEPSLTEETVQQSAEEQAEAIEYAKKILTKAWQDYYKAAQEAKEAGIRIEDGEVSDEMQNIQDSITEIVDKWKTRLPDGKDASWHLAALGDYITDEEEAWTFDEIGQKISDAFDDNKIALGIPLDEIKKQANGLEELQDEMKATAQVAEQTSEATKGAQTTATKTEAEVAQMGALAAKVKEVSDAVDKKTQAFEEEYVTVDGAVEAEIAALNQLQIKLENIRDLIAQIFSGKQLKIGELDGVVANEDNNTGKSSIPGLLGEISASLSSICGILEGVTGVKSKGEDSVTKTKPVVEDAMGSDGLDDQDFGVLNNMLSVLKEIAGKLSVEKLDETPQESYALENTLLESNRILGQILTEVKTEVQEGQKISSVQESITKLVNTLTPAVKTLQDVASGIVQAQERAKTDTSVAQARIANAQSREGINQAAINAVNGMRMANGDVKVTQMLADKDGMVRVIGYVQTAADEWAEFTMRVNEACEVSKLAYDINGRAAKQAAAAAKEVKRQEENKPKYDPITTVEKAREELRKRSGDDAETRVQFQDSGRYTVSAKKTIGNLSQEIFQTFDSDVKAMERTTVTVSDGIATALKRTHKLIEENSQGLNGKLLTDYNAAHDALAQAEATYANRSNLSDDEIADWNKKIELVQRLGQEMTSLIRTKQRSAQQPKTVEEEQKQAELFANKHNKQLLDFGKYVTDTKASVELTESLNAELVELEDRLVNISDEDELKAWQLEFAAFKNSVNDFKKSDEFKLDLAGQKGSLNTLLKDVQSEFKSISLDESDSKQKAIIKEYNELVDLIQQKITLGRGASEEELADMQSRATALKNNIELQKQANALANLPTAKSDQAKNLKDFADNLKNSNLLTADLSNRLNGMNSELNDVKTPKQLDEWIEKFGKLQGDIDAFLKSLKQAGISGGTSKIQDAYQFINNNLGFVGNEDLFNRYAVEHATLVNMQNDYTSRTSLNQADLDTWKQQIDLVQRLGKEISDLIVTRQKLTDQPGVESSAAMLGEYRTAADKIFKGLDFNLTTKDKNALQQGIADEYTKIIEYVKLLQKSHAVLTDSQVADINRMIESLQRLANAYSKGRENVAASKSFREDKTAQQNTFDEYRKSLDGMGNVSDELKAKLQQLGEELGNVGDQDGLDKWKNSFEELKTSIAKGMLSEMTDLRRQAGAQVRGLGFKDTDANLEDDQKEIIALRKQLMVQIDEYVAKVRSGQVAEIAGINETKAALLEKIRLYKEAHNVDEQKAHKNVYTGELNTYKRDINKSLKNIGFDVTDENLEGTQKEIADLYMQMRVQIEAAASAAKRGEQVELSAIKSTKQALQEKINLYKQENGIFDNNKVNNAVERAQKAYNLADYNVRGSEEYSRSSVLVEQLKEYKATLLELQDLQRKANTTDGLTSDETTKFDSLIRQCNEYAKSIDGVIQSSENLRKSQKNVKTTPIDFDIDVGDAPAIQKVLEDYVRETHQAKAAIGDFKAGTNSLVFTVEEADGTIKQYAASLNAAKTAIVTTYEGTAKSTSLLGSMFDSLKKKTKELWVYMGARLGVDELIQALRTGVQSVRDIDSALTELKKVTDETDGAYDRFLQNMSKTAGVVGSTVKDLTTMAAEWARLGYSMEESALLAKNTAILLNVSEFDDATEASEALISTMQAFQYTADESGHVVDILNEVGEYIARR